MASIQETTACSIRKGNTAENLAFTGVIGEVTADLGIDGNGTDINTTLRLHNAVTAGGISMARSDLTNIDTKALAENRSFYGDENLAYADLSNIEELTDTEKQETVRDYMHEYGLALNSQITTLESTKANVTMDNVNTSSLATSAGHSGDNLAYANMSNVTTVDLATSTGHTGDNLAYYNFTNADTSNLVVDSSTRPSGMSGPVLANATLANVTDNTIKTRLDTLNVEYTTNRKNTIDTTSSTLSTEYPTSNAVINYVENEISSAGHMDSNLDNASSWNPLYATSNAGYIYDNDITKISTNGTNFTVTITENSQELQTYAPTTQALTDTTNLKLAVYTLDADNKPDTFRLYPEFGTTQLTNGTIVFTNSIGSTATGNLTCTAHPSLIGVYHYAIGMSKNNIVANGWVANNDADITKVPCYNNTSNITITPVLTARIDTVSSGAISQFVFDPKTTQTAITTAQSITIGHPFVVTVTEDPTTQEKQATATIQSGNNATFSLTTTTDSSLPLIGGANVLKTSLDNLPGMKTLDIIENNSANWSINKAKPVPAGSASTIDSTEYERIATIGQVWDHTKTISEVLPSQTGQAGKFLTTDGTNSSWSNNVVTLTGMQTISGIKVFTDNPILQSAQPTVKLYETDVEKGVTPSQTENSFLGIVYDKNGSSQSNKLAQVFSEYKADGSLSLNMSCFNPVSGSTASDKIMIAYDSSNQSYTQCPTPTEDTTSSVQIDTVGARNTKINNSCVHLTGNETITGTKTFNDSTVIVGQVTSSSSTNTTYGQVYFEDSSDNVRGLVQSWNGETGETALVMRAQNSLGHLADIQIWITENSQVHTVAPVPTEDTTSSVQIDTVGARNTALANKIQLVSTLPASPVSGVLYVIPE